MARINVNRQKKAAPIAIAIDETNASEKILGVFLTENCNAYCAHCFNESGPKRTRELHKNDVFQFIERAIEIGFAPKKIGLSGGEPFLHTEFFDIISTVKKYDLEISCITGGTVEHDAILESVSCGVDNVIVSWDRYHRAFVDFEELKALAQNIDRYTPVNLNIGEVFRGEMHWVVDSFADLELNNCVTINFFPIERVGRGSRRCEVSPERGSDAEACEPTSNFIVLDVNRLVHKACDLSKLHSGDNSVSLSEFLCKVS